MNEDQARFVQCLSKVLFAFLSLSFNYNTLLPTLVSSSWDTSRYSVYEWSSTTPYVIFIYGSTLFHDDVIGIVVVCISCPPYKPHNLLNGDIIIIDLLLYWSKQKASLQPAFKLQLNFRTLPKSDDDWVLSLEGQDPLG